MTRIAKGRGVSDCYPECHRAEVIWNRTPIPSLRSTGLCLGMASGLNGVMDIAVITDMVVCWQALRKKLAPSLLPGLGSPSPQTARAIIGGVTTISACR